MLFLLRLFGRGIASGFADCDGSGQGRQDFKLNAPFDGKTFSVSESTKEVEVRAALPSKQDDCKSRAGLRLSKLRLSIAAPAIDHRAPDARLTVFHVNAVASARHA
jgi:hypothetical protein